MSACDHAFVRTLVDFMPAPTGKGVVASTTDDPVSAATTTESGEAKVTGGEAKVTGGEASPDAAESTIYIAPEVVDSIIGLNQDSLPIILQSGAPAGILNAITGGESDLCTIPRDS
jgi:hypothetical protein